MATLEHEPFPTVLSMSLGEAVPKQPEVSVYEVIDEDPDPGNPTTLAAEWDNDSKLAADVDYSKGVTGVDKVRRPSHWGEDNRSYDEQLPEYVMGLKGIVQYILEQRSVAVEVGPLNGLAAEALVEIEAPVGWLRRTKIIKYDAWFEDEAISVSRAAADGATISARYEKTPDQPEPELGKLYRLPSQTSEFSPAA